MLVIKRTKPRETIERIAKIFALTDKPVLVQVEGSEVTEAESDEAFPRRLVPNTESVRPATARLRGSLFLGDVYEQFYQHPPNRIYFQGKHFAWFAEDTWKVRPRLTITLGIRHDIPTGIERKNGVSNFDPNLPNPGADGRPGSLYFLPQGRLYPTYKKEFGPRFGLAYNLNDKTVLRLGYGLLNTFTYGESPFGGGGLCALSDEVWASNAIR